MMEINFFEKEKRNILPYAVLGIFVVALLLMSIYFYFMRMNFEQTVQNNNQWLDEHAEEITTARQIAQFERLTTQSIDVQEILKAQQYPMDYLIEEIVSHIPNETERVATFQINQAAAQIALVLENLTTEEAQSIVLDLEEQSYVEGVQFLRVDNQLEEERQLRFELVVDLNHEVLSLEASK